LTQEYVGVPDIDSYSAPDMLLSRGRRDDPRQDLYSLGVILFQMAAGRMPWARDELADLAKALLAGRKPRWLRTILPKADPQLAAVIDRALALDPAARWQSARDFRGALRSVGVFVSGALIADTYRIERQLGKGGMSVVYLARDVRMERTCALKVLHVTDANEAFHAERATAHSFQNDDIIFARKGRLGLARRPPSINKYVFSHTVFIVRAKPIVSSEYLLWCLRQDACVEWLLHEMNSNTGVPTLGKAYMERLPIQIPTQRAEQLEVVHRVTALFQLAIDGISMEADRQLGASNSVSIARQYALASRNFRAHARPSPHDKPPLALRAGRRSRRTAEQVRTAGAGMTAYARPCEGLSGIRCSDLFGCSCTRRPTPQKPRSRFPVVSWPSTNARSRSRS
jgi:hypothetical protein